MLIESDEQTLQEGINTLKEAVKGLEQGTFKGVIMISQEQLSISDEDKSTAAVQVDTVINGCNAVTFFALHKSCDEAVKR